MSIVVRQYNNGTKEYAPEFAGTEIDCKNYAERTYLARGESFAIRTK